MIWSLFSLACTIVILAGYLRLRQLFTDMRGIFTMVVERSIRMELVVRAVREYRDHGTASTWRGVLAQLERFEASEPPRQRPPPLDSLKH